MTLKLKIKDFILLLIFYKLMFIPYYVVALSIS
jgi:hypothetical protein